MLCDPSPMAEIGPCRRRRRGTPRNTPNTPDPATHQRPHRRPLPNGVIPGTTIRYGCVTLHRYHFAVSVAGPLLACARWASPQSSTSGKRRPCSTCTAKISRTPASKRTNPAVCQGPAAASTTARRPYPDANPYSRPWYQRGVKLWPASNIHRQLKRVLTSQSSPPRAQARS
jgi:hypothetical protein